MKAVIKNPSVKKTKKVNKKPRIIEGRFISFLEDIATAIESGQKVQLDKNDLPMIKQIIRNMY